MGLGQLGSPASERRPNDSVGEARCDAKARPEGGEPNVVATESLHLYDAKESVEKPAAEKPQKNHGHYDGRAQTRRPPGQLSDS